MNDLETRLRGELASGADRVSVASDAWARNQRRLRDRDGLRRRRRLQAGGLVAAVAAGIVAAGAVGLPARVSGADPADGSGARGQAGVTRTDPVEIAAVGTGRDRIVIVASLAPGKDATPDLCVRVRQSGDSSGGCGGQSPHPGGPTTAFDYLSGSVSGTGASGIRILDGAVDKDVDHVRAWLTDGTEVSPRLVPLGSSGLRAFAVVTRGGAPGPARVAAYHEDNVHLEYVNVAKRFGPDWATRSVADQCRCDVAAQEPTPIASVAQTGSTVTVLLWPEAEADTVAVTSSLTTAPKIVRPGKSDHGLLRSVEVRFGSATVTNIKISVFDGRGTWTQPVP